jgi:hypothetical protein
MKTSYNPDPIVGSALLLTVEPFLFGFLSVFSLQTLEIFLGLVLSVFCLFYLKEVGAWVDFFTLLISITNVSSRAIADLL